MSVTTRTNTGDLAVARLLTQDRGRTNFEALIRALCDAGQTLEGVCADLRDSRDVGTATGDALTKLGNLIGEARASKPDDLYRLFIQARTALNRSTGSGESIYAVARALLDPADYDLLLTDYPPASWVLTISGEPAPAAIADMAALIIAARSAGVGTAVVYSEVVDAEGFTVEDAADAPETSTDQGFADLVVNLLTQSEAFDHADWAKNGCTIDANATADPLGGSTADGLDASGSVEPHSVLQNVTVAAGDIIGSVYGKGGNVDWLLMTFSGTASGFANFDVTNGVVGAVSGVTAAIAVDGNGFYRCSAILAATAGTVTLSLGSLESDNGPDYAGAAGDLFLWGAQLEQASALRSYVQSTTTQGQAAYQGGQLAGVI